MLAIFVTIQVKPAFRDKFIEATFDDARGAVRDEPGCYRFDVMQDSSDENRFHLHEVYADRAALEAVKGGVILGHGVSTSSDYVRVMDQRLCQWLLCQANSYPVR